MNLYEIENAILNCVDEETGEIIDFDMLRELQMNRAVKIENIGLWYKNIMAEVDAFKKEIEALNFRKSKAESKAEQIKAYLTTVLSGEKFETAKVQMSWRKSKAVEVDDEFINWAEANGIDELLTYKPPIPDKKRIKAFLDTETLEHAKIVENNNLTIR